MVVENGYEEDMQGSDEDEVFVQDAGSDSWSASRPLMHPRSKGSTSKSGPSLGLSSISGSGSAKVRAKTMVACRLCALCKPVFYFIALVTVLCSIMAAIVYIANNREGGNGKAGTGDFKLDSSSASLSSGQNDANSGQSEQEASNRFMGSDQMSVEDVWTQTFPKLLTESAFRLVEVNGDGIDDVIFGFATGKLLAGAISWLV